MSKLKFVTISGKPRNWDDEKCSEAILKLGLDVKELQGLKIKINPLVNKSTKEVRSDECTVEVLKSQNKPWSREWTSVLRQIFNSDGYTNGWLDYVTLDSVSVPKAEKKIKISSEGAMILKTFVDKNLKEIDNNHEITTFYIDTEAEFKKYGIQIPGICLVVADKRATKASLKKEPLVKKFDLSKTLKRYSDWKKGTVANVDGECWYCIYVSALDARNNGIKALKEEIEMKKIGYLNEEGDIVRIPVVGEAVKVSDEYYIVESVDGQMVGLLNEEDSFEVNEEEIDEDIIEVTESENIGKEKDGMICLGMTELGEAYSDGSDDVYINEGFSDKLEGEMVYRCRKTGKPIVTGQDDPKKDTIMYWDTEGNHFTIKKSEFSKKFKAGKAEDFDLFEARK